MVKPKTRRFICQLTGKPFLRAVGPGRPPLYHPSVREEVRAKQLAAAQRRYRERVRQYKQNKAAKAANKGAE